MSLLSTFFSCSSDEEEFYDADEELIDLDNFESEKSGQESGDSNRTSDAAIMSSVGL